MLDGLKPYPEYKDSGQRWIGAVPARWHLGRMATVARLRSQKGRTDLPLLSVFLNRGVIPYGQGGGQVHKPSLDLANYQVVRPGDLVLNNQQAWRGSVGVSRHLGIISPAYVVMELPTDSDAGYCDFLFQSRPMVAQFVTSSKGVGDIQRDIHLPWLKNMVVALPSPAEQAGIVRFLGAVDRRVNRFIRAKRRLIEVLTEQKQAIITHAVTKGLNPHDPGARFKASGIDWLGDVPAHWEVKRLRHIIEGRLTYGANEAAEHERTDWPRYLRITDFGGDGGLRADTFRSLPPEIAADYMVQPGDILLARSGATVGKAFLVDERAINACHAGYLIRARPKQAQANPRFLFLYTQSTAYASWRAATFNIATIENIGADKYANLPVPLPPRDEQDEILKGLAELLKPIDGAAAVARREIDLIREFRTRLVADVVTGKVDVRAAAAALPDELPESAADPSADEGEVDSDAEDSDATHEAAKEVDA